MDFYCHQIRLAIEVDGPTHFTEKARKYDQIRQKYIESYGIHLLRVNNLDIYRNINGVADQVSHILINSQKINQKLDYL